MVDQQQSAPGLFDRLAEHFGQRVRRGENPDIGQYARKYPALAAEINELFPVLRMMERAAPGDSGDASLDATPAAARPGREVVSEMPERVGDYRILREIGAGGMGVVYEAQQESLGRRVALKLLPAAHVGDSKMRQRFHREARAAARLHHTNIVPVYDTGCEGPRFYYAMQFIQGQSFDNVIAELARLRRGEAGTSGPGQAAAPSQGAAAAQPRGRRRPAVAAASTPQPTQTRQHAPPHAAGPRPIQSPERATDAGRAHSTTENGLRADSAPRLPGQKELSAVTSDLAYYFRSVARIGEQVADALSYAHARNIVHRDIKPSNLLLDTSGVVWITDFGLVKTDDDTGLTRSGDMPGTLRYMSPERFEGQCDARADIYAVGVTLYELLTLRPAFPEADRLALVEHIVHREPARPRSLDAHIPRDLETIVLKAIDKDPARRYRSADELRDDLHRFVDDEPVQARRISAAERLARWARRNKAVAASLATVFLLVTVLAVGASGASVWFKKMADDYLALAIKHKEAEQKATIAKDAESTARQEAEDAKGREKKQKEEAEGQRDALAAAKELQDRIIDGMRLASLRDIIEQPGRMSAVMSTLSDICDRPRNRDLFEVNWLLGKADAPRLVLRNHTDSVNCAAIDPAGKRVAAGGGDGRIVVCDVETGARLSTLHSFEAKPTCVRWSPDGRRIASIHDDGVIRIWDAASGQIALTLHGCGRGWPQSVDWSRNGKRIASAGSEGTVRVWDAATGRQLRAHRLAGRGLTSIRWHPDDVRVAIGGFDGLLVVLDAASGREVARLKSSSAIVLDVAWSPQGDRLASAHGDKVARIWSAENWKEPIRPLNGHWSGYVAGVAWSPDGKRLVSAGSDDTAILWDAEHGRILRRLVGHQDAIWSVDWSRDGQTLVTCGPDRTVRLWDADLPWPVQLPMTKPGSLALVAWSAAPDRLAYVGPDGDVRVWDIETRRLLATYDAHGGRVLALGLAPGGKTVASVGADNLIHLWEAETGKRVRTIGGASKASPVEHLAWRPDGKRLATGDGRGMVRTWDPDSGTEVRTIQVHSSKLRALAWSPDGNLLAAKCDKDGRIRIWSVETGKEVARLELEKGQAVTSLVFSPDGRRLAAACTISSEAIYVGVKAIEGVADVWEWEKKDAPPLRLRFPNQSIVSVAWRPDGSRLASVNFWNSSPVLWDVAPGQEHRGMERMFLQLDRHFNTAQSVCWSRDGTRLFSVDEKGSLLIHDAAQGFRVARSPKILPALDQAVREGRDLARNLRVRAEILALQGRWDDATKDLERLAQTQPGAAAFYIMPTWVIGPYPARFDDLQHLDLQRELPPEKQTDVLKPVPALKPPAPREEPGVPALKPPAPGAEPRWRPLLFEAGGYVNFNTYFPEGAKTCYAQFRIYSPRRQAVAMLIGVDDTLRLWCNGALVHEKPRGSSMRADSTIVEVVLDQGWSTVLAKVGDLGGDHALLLRVTDDEAHIAHAYAKTKQLDKALEHWDRAVALAPNNALYCLQRFAVKSQLAAGDAEADFAKAVELLPGQVEPFVFRARLAENLGNEKDWLANITRAIEIKADLPELLVMRANIHLRHHRLKEGAADLAQAYDLDPTDNAVAVMLAPLLAYLGDEEAYGRLRKAMLERWADTDNPVFAERTVKGAVLLPLGAPEAETTLQLAERAAAAGPEYSSHKHFLFAKGAAEFRAGRAQDALETLTALQRTSKGEQGWFGALIGLVSAMAQHQLGNDEDARKALADARGQIVAACPGLEVPAGGVQWDWLRSLVLYREAEKLIGRNVDPAEVARREADIQKRPEDHPDSIADLQWLIEYYARQRRRGDEERVRVQLLKLRRNVSGEKHPDTQEDKKQLSFLYWNWATDEAVAGRWAAAAAKTTGWIDLYPTHPWGYLSRAAFLLKAGDREKYEQCCAQLLALPDLKKKAQLVRLAVKLLTVVPPEATSPISPRLPELARLATDLEPNLCWTHLARGMAECRAGNLAAAAEWLLKAEKTQDDACRCTALLFRALVECRQGSRGPAQQAFVQAQTLLAKMQAAAKKPEDRTDFNLLFCEIIAEEAGALLKQ